MLFLGSFPPRECGIATFMKDVVDSYDATFGTRSAVIAIDEPGGEDRVYPDQVVASLVQDDHESYREIADFVNAYPCDVLNIQHEFGLFGGDDGAWILELIAGVRKPVVTSLHTVLPDPSPEHLELARAICATSSAIVVLSETGRDVLIERYGVDPAKVRVIHHGVPDVPFRDTVDAKKRLGFAGRMTISTFGLISRGKGLEYAINAMGAVAQLHPEALYLILGQTHPVVRRNEGESYRRELEASIAANGLAENVKLVDKYLDYDELITYLSASDIYLTPYLNPGADRQRHAWRTRSGAARRSCRRRICTRKNCSRTGAASPCRSATHRRSRRRSSRCSTIRSCAKPRSGARTNSAAA